MLARALEKSLGLKTWVYLGPHLSRKHFLLMAEKFGGCVQRSALPPSPQSRSWEREWASLWQKLTVSDLRSLCPDSGGHLDCFPAEYSAERLSLECGGVPPMVVSCWTCLLHDVVGSEGPAAYLFAKRSFAKLEAALDAMLREHGDARPPCPWVLMKAAMTKEGPDIACASPVPCRQAKL